MDQIPVTLNGSQVNGRPGMTILELAREQGIHIPTLCYSPDLSLIGACRLSVVEIEGARTLAASCHTPIAPNMVIHTNSPKVLKARQVIVELMMASHPEFCWVCDRANVCDLRKLAMEVNMTFPRFTTKKRPHQIEEVSPYIWRDLAKCVLCQRCIKACSEIKKADVYAMGYRGFDCKVVVDTDVPIDKEVCRDCGICIPYCPVAALGKPEERYQPKKMKPTIITG